jgi:hypothetical protein
VESNFHHHQRQVEMYLVYLITVAAVVAAAVVVVVVAVSLNCSNLCLLNSLIWTYLNHLYPNKIPIYKN